MKRVLILGGGFGGVAAAYRLKQKLAGDVEVVLVDRRSDFMVGFRKTWALLGVSALEAGRRPLESLTRLGVRVLGDAVQSIDPQTRSAQIGGQRFEADALIIALGAELAPELIPGLQEHGLNVYDAQEIPRAAQALREFSGGKLVLGIFGAPYKCSPAPYEMALLIKEEFNRRGATASVEVFTPQPMSLPILGQAGCDIIESRLAERGITFLANHKPTAVEAGEVVFGDKRRPYDLLLAVPPHRPPLAVRESGLVDSSGWVSVDSRTLQTQFPHVYAIGDVIQIMLSNGKPLPKAGVLAQAMGEVVADRIIEELAGRQPAATFSGEGGCYLEVGTGLAMKVEGSFLAAPEPQVVLTEPSEAFFEEKRDFERQLLETWFGS